MRIVKDLFGDDPKVKIALILCWIMSDNDFYMILPPPAIQLPTKCDRCSTREGEQANP